MTATTRIITNAEVQEIELAVPSGHRHLRATIRLHDGEELVLHEATVANLVRAYVGIKTHPLTTAVRLKSRHLEQAERKEGYAGWQLLEE